MSFLTSQFVIIRKLKLLIYFKQLSYVRVNADDSSDVIVLLMTYFESDQKWKIRVALIATVHNLTPNSLQQPEIKMLGCFYLYYFFY